MRVRFKDSCVTSEGLFGVGQIHDLPADLAAGFIAAGHAQREDAGEVEEATAPDAPETAVSRKSKGRK